MITCESKRTLSQRSSFSGTHSVEAITAIFLFTLCGCGGEFDESLLFSPLGPHEGTFTLSPTGKVAVFSSARVASLTQDLSLPDPMATLVANFVPRFYGELDAEVDVLLILVDSSTTFLSGRMFRTVESAEGIGALAAGPEFPELTTFDTRLKGVIILNGYSSILYGPFLHEFVHLFANILTGPVGEQSSVPGHWGVSSVGGQLGGWGAGSLLDVGGGQYQASGPRGGTFGSGVNNGNSVPYAPLELYLMGLIGPEGVPPVVQALDPEFIGNIRLDETDEATVFSASGFRTITIEGIIEDNGPRFPSYIDSQKVFRLACLVITDVPVADERLEAIECMIRFMEGPAQLLATETCPQLGLPDLAALLGEISESRDDRLIYNFAAATQDLAAMEFVTLGFR